MVLVPSMCSKYAEKLPRVPCTSNKVPLDVTIWLKYLEQIFVYSGFSNEVVLLFVNFYNSINLILS